MAATYTVKQVAHILGYSTNSIYTFLKEKRIRGVRLGKGRFRIPQSEVNRLLMVTKAPPVLSSSGMPMAEMGFAPQPLVPVDVTMQDMRPPGITLEALPGSKITIVLPNIFNWFTGTAAVVTGVALFLFNNSFGTALTAGFAPVVHAARIILIAAGLGILFTDIIDGHYLVWRKVFQAILACLGIFMGVMLGRAGDFDGGVVYGFMGLTLMIALVTGASGIPILSVYGSFLAAALPILLLVGQGDPHIDTILMHLQMSPVAAASVSVIIALLFIIGIWVGYFKNRSLYWALTWMGGSVAIALAFIYAQENYWSRGFFYITLGLTSFFAPVWGSLRHAYSRKAQFFIHWMFASIFVVLLFAVWGVHWMQLYTIEQTKRHLESAVLMGKSLVEDALEDVQATVVATATNEAFVTAVEKRDVAVLNGLSRIIYESNHDIRRVVVLDAVGDGFFLYPFGTFDQKNLAFRDYFQAAKTSRAPYVSDVFAALTDQSNRRVVTVSMPLINKEGKFIGVVAASVNIDYIGLQLQKLVKDAKGEYFVVVDSAGKRIMHPDVHLIGQQISTNDLTRTGAEGKRGSATGYTAYGKEALYAYDTIANRHWGIAVKAPLTDALAFSDQANIAVFATVVISILIVTCFLILLRQRVRDGRDIGGGGSP